MDRNDPNLNTKQRELVKRLEEIRRQRSGQTQSDVEGNEQSLEQQPDSRMNDRNRPRQRQTTSRPHTRKAASRRRNERANQRNSSETRDSDIRSQEMRSMESTSRTGDYSSSIGIEEPSRSRKTSRQKKRTRKSNHLIKQLSDGNRLADAIILNEVLSKPVALKKRYR